MNLEVIVEEEFIRDPPVAQPLFSIVPTDKEPGTGYSIIQDVALFRNKPSYQFMTKDIFII